MITFILTLIIIGQALLFIELAIIPGLGVAGVLGLGAIAGSCYLSFANISTTAGIMIILINIILATIVVMLTLRKKTWKRFSLDTNIDAKIDTPIKEKGVSVGDTGTAITRLAPSGTAAINGNTLEVTTRGTLIDPQKSIEVTEISNNKVYVKEK
ncbi:MAG: NfeD family protein [Bacteroidales bacterium]|jgi:membrane-bound ClpP family serine protease|nr:NfeD family protein [Bacteroidales bacterium]